MGCYLAVTSMPWKEGQGVPEGRAMSDLRAEKGAEQWGETVVEESGAGPHSLFHPVPPEPLPAPVAPEPVPERDMLACW